MDRCIGSFARGIEGGLESLTSESRLVRALMVLPGLSAITGDIEGKTA